MIIVWLATVAAAGWLAGLDQPSGYAVLLGVALAIGLVLSYQETVMRWVCGFGAGIVLVLAADRLGEQGAEQGVVYGVGLVGVAAVAGSLAAAARGR